MTKTYRPNTKLRTEEYIADYHNGMSITEISKKYCVDVSVVRGLLNGLYGHIGRAKIEGRHLRPTLRKFYEDNFLVIAHAIVERAGTTELCKRLKIRVPKMKGVVRDLLSENAYLRLTRRRYRRVVDDELKRTIRREHSTGVSIDALMKRYGFGHQAIRKILDEEKYLW